MRVLLTVGTSLVAAVVAVPVAAAGTIVPGISLAGVKLGDSAAAITTRLGPRAHKQPGPPGSGVVRYDYPTHNHLTVVMHNGHAESISMTALRGDHVYDHTAKGVGLLSTMAAWRSAYPADCFKNGPAPPGCTFNRGTTWMRLLANGTSWATPLLSIELSYRGH